MSMAADKHDFTSNLYCADVVDTDCYEGRADCRMSCSLLNHKVMISEHDNGVYAVPGMEREVGYVFNQTLVETYFGKCAMIYDGASMHSYNGGCGRGARGTPNCTDPKSAFFDQCEDHPPAHTCTREDPEVENWMCKCDAAWCADGGYGHLHPPSRNSGPQGRQCIYEMPALITDDITETNHLRDSLKQRIISERHNQDMMGNWNEVVLDNKLLIPALQADPANVIIAFVYPHRHWYGRDSENQMIAMQMRDQFHEEYGMAARGLPKIPVLALRSDVEVYTSGGPFSLPIDPSGPHVEIA